MKNFKALAFLLLAIVGISCSDDDNNNNNNNNNDDRYIRFTLNGTEQDYNDPMTISSLSTSVNAQTGTGPSLRRIVLWMPNDPTVGSHNLSDSPSDVDAYSVVYYQGEDITVAANSGVMVISAVTDDYVQGTFTFTEEVDGVTYAFTDAEFRVDR